MGRFRIFGSTLLLQVHRLIVFRPSQTKRGCSHASGSSETRVSHPYHGVRRAKAIRTSSLITVRTKERKVWVPGGKIRPGENPGVPIAPSPTEKRVNVTKGKRRSFASCKSATNTGNLCGKQKEKKGKTSTKKTRRGGQRPPPDSPPPDPPVTRNFLYRADTTLE